MLEVRNIAFSYRRRPVLTDVSFVVSPGETVSIIGANGAGKTTLLNVLSTMLIPSAGKILVDGRDALVQPEEYRRKIGYLPERVTLYDDMTVREYLTYRASLKGEKPKRVRHRVGEAVEMCRIGSLLKSGIGSLSNGQRKRVALADAILLRPRVLILDDLLAGLDHEMRSSLGEALSEAAAFSSVIVTGHELDDLVRWTTRFLVLRDGRIVASVDTSGSDEGDLMRRLGTILEGGRP